MATDVTMNNVQDAKQVTHELLTHLFADRRTPPGVVVAALAMALGSVCGHFGVKLLQAVWLLEESRRAAIVQMEDNDETGTQ
jgi:hypothetical protein